MVQGVRGMNECVASMLTLVGVVGTLAGIVTGFLLGRKG